MTVDDFVSVKASGFNNRNCFQREAHNTFNISQLQTTNFNGVQSALESGSGPGAHPADLLASPLDSGAANLTGVESC